MWRLEATFVLTDVMLSPRRFGEIGIDEDLIASRAELGDENIIEMNNGCICCTIRGDLVTGLKKILSIGKGIVRSHFELLRVTAFWICMG